MNWQQRGIDGKRPQGFLPNKGDNIRVEEWIVPALGVATLIATCRVASAKSLLWLDEMVTHILMGSPDYHHMIKAVRDGVECTPPFYWTVMWAWSYYLGVSDFSLRLFSAIAMGLAFTAAWLLARRIAGFWAATLTCSVLFFLNDYVFQRSTECRPYALLVAILAIVLLQFERISRRRPTPFGDLLIYSVLVSVLVLTHLFGFVYSAALLAALVLSDWINRRFRPFHYLAGILGWAAFLPWIPAFENQSKIGIPWFWIPKPDWRVLTDPATYSFGVSPILLLVLLAVSFGAWLLRSKGSGAGNGPGSGAMESFVPLQTAALFLVFGVPWVTWIYSVLERPIWLERYLMPAFLGWIIILAPFAQSILASARQATSGFSALASRWISVTCVALGALIAAFAFGHFLFRAIDLQSMRIAVNRAPYRNEPTVTQSASTFLYLSFYQPRVDPYFILDWPSALTSQNRGAVADFHVMSALKENFPAFKILPAAVFLATHDRFMEVDHDKTDWIPNLIATDPTYHRTEIGKDVSSVVRTR
jgi:dolichyl-phosphate-mannose-protein mannosyltransferase